MPRRVRDWRCGYKGRDLKQRSNGKHLPDVDTMRILGLKEGKHGESVLENIVYRVNTQPLYLNGHVYAHVTSQKKHSSYGA